MTAQLTPAPVFRSWDNLGLPLVGGKLNTYAAGTTAPQATYTDSTQGTPNTNPVILNFRGEAFVWLDPTLTYKFVLTDAFNNLIWTEDNIPGSAFVNASGTISVSSNLVPSTTNLFTLGSPASSWANVYLGPSEAPVFDPVSGNVGYYARTAAEIAAGVTPTNYVYAPGPMIDPRRYGADPTGIADSTTAIQNAILVATQSGGLIFIAPGTYKITSTLKLRPNVTIWGAGCGDSSTIGIVTRCTILQPANGFSGTDIIRADPADFGSDVYCRGVSISNLMIDMGNVTGTANLVAIRLKSVSDNPTFENLRVWNMGATHVAVQVGVSTNSSALQTDGTIFSNLVTLTSAIDTYTASMVILEDCNEMAIRDSKILSRSNGAPQSSCIGIQIKGTAIGCQGITIDGCSFGGLAAGVETTGTGGGVGARWVRVHDCTFEACKYGVFLTGILALQAQFCTLGPGNRFISNVAGGANFFLDFAADCTVIADEFSLTTNVQLTANSSANTVWAALAGITDAGTNNTKYGRNGAGMQFSSLFGQALQTPTLINSWAQFSPVNRSAVGYWLGPDGIVHLQGHISSGTVGSAAFVLPAGYLPAKTKEFAVASNNAFGMILIDPATGNVTPQVGSNVFFALDGINFRAGD